MNSEEGGSRGTYSPRPMFLTMYFKGKKSKAVYGLGFFHNLDCEKDAACGKIQEAHPCLKIHF